MCFHRADCFYDSTNYQKHGHRVWGGQWWGNELHAAGLFPNNTFGANLSDSEVPQLWRDVC